MSFMNIDNYGAEKQCETGEWRGKKNESKAPLDKVRGSLFGGAVGDALGYYIEFWGESEIFSTFGEKGIQQYALESRNDKALISDDTQMSLFTASGVLSVDLEVSPESSGTCLRDYVAKAYMDWLLTQEKSYEESREVSRRHEEDASWLLDVPELFSRRAPGNTCISALSFQSRGMICGRVGLSINHSKGCGGVMRVAPLALWWRSDDKLDRLDREGADIAAITHGHPLGYMSAAVLVHIINRIVYPVKEMTLKEIIQEAMDTVQKVFEGEPHLEELARIVKLAVSLSENSEKDIDNIHRIGEGWIAEEALAISIYCALKYQNDFSAGIIAAVNHRGDSDSTGAITGNILGAIVGYEAMEEKWKENLELSDVILKMADELCC